MFFLFWDPQEQDQIGTPRMHGVDAGLFDVREIPQMLPLEQVGATQSPVEVQGWVDLIMRESWFSGADWRFH